MKENYDANNKIIYLINIDELKKAIKDIKIDSATGMDMISNHMLKNLPDETLLLITSLFNRCLTIKKIPDDWKIAKISMIPKKANEKNNPLNYRPISVTSCLGKIFERIINYRLYNFLEKNKLIIQEQSGFRKKRRTSDNLYFLIQKATESLNRSKNLCCIFFDINKAFDKVWHKGLIYKLLKLKVPMYIVQWVESFLTNRKFKVSIEDYLSEAFPISAGVPQGAAISPLLFSIYINDVPKRNIPNISQSLLFADDLVTIFTFKKDGHIVNTINKYLNEIEKWLIKWKMKMSANKCNYITFSNSKKKKRFNLYLNKDLIPYAKEIKFLGMTFDENLNFLEHIKSLRAKCFERLNIIKILSNKNWKLEYNTLISIYKTLVRSLIDYSFPFNNVISDLNLRKLQVIQNNSIRYIYKLPFDSGTNEIYEICRNLGLDMIKDRLNELNDNFLKDSIDNQNPLIIKLINEYKAGFNARFLKQATPLCGAYLIIDNYFR